MRAVSDVAFMAGLTLLVVGAVLAVVGSGQFDVLRRRRGGAATHPRPVRRLPHAAPWFWAGGTLVAVAVVATLLQRP
jgi:hypothetical protein